MISDEDVGADLGTGRRLRVFVTGATGFIGSAVVRALQGRGHRVAGLARSPASIDRLVATGVQAVRGDLEHVDSFSAALSTADVIVHAGFPRQAFDQMAAAVRIEQQATARLADTASRAGALLIYTSGIGVVGETGSRAFTEDDPVNTPPGMAWRRDLEMRVLESGRGIVLRPAFVYGCGGGEILRTLIETAMNNRRSLYPGDGRRCWPNIHVNDLGEAYTLTVERAAPGDVLNLAAGEATLRSVSEAVGRLIGEPGATSSVPRAEAIGVLPYADWLGATGTRIGSTRARQVLGWEPTRPDIHWEIEFGSYRSLLREPHSDPERGQR